MTTGVGARKKIPVPAGEAGTFNRALIANHLVGAGPDASAEIVRATMLRLANALASRPVLIKLPSGKVVSLVRTSDAQTVQLDVPVNPPGSSPRRVSWRELIN